DVTNYFTNTWWNSDSITNQNNWSQFSSDWAQVGYMHQLETNSAISNFIVSADPGRMMEIWATNWVKYGYCFEDPYIGAGEVNWMGCAYDWLYDIMTDQQRSNVLHAMELVAQDWVYQQWYYNAPGKATDAGNNFTNILRVRFGSAAREGESHSRNGQAALAVTLAGMGESQILRDMQTYYLNYYIAQFDPFQGDDGRSYNAAQNFDMHRQFASWLMACSVFPDLRLTNAPIYTSLADQFA